ncbi:MAG: TPM domain-containing protein [Gammaproteobacteria bacterium]
MTGGVLRAALLLLLLLLIGVSRAELAVPPLTARVMDLAGLLTPTQRQTLEQTLRNFEARKGSQIAVLTVDSTKPETAEQFSIRVVENWKLGRKGVDDGVLLLVAKDDRTLRIEGGYGLEGAIPDAVAKRVTDEIIAPYFKQGDFYGGIEAGVNRLIRLIDGEPLPPPGAHDLSWSGLKDVLPAIFIMTMVGANFLGRLFGRLIGGTVTGTVAALLLWFTLGSLLLAIVAGVLVFLFAISLFSGGAGGGIGGFYGMGGFGGGGGSGGGFSGGGGGFGGGGASGRW